MVLLHPRESPSAMAGHRSSPDEELHPVFIDTSLGTHFAVSARHTDTVADLRRMLIPGHLSSFPGFGEIRIEAIKVKRRGHFYRLQDPIPLRHIFKRKDYWYIYLDASASASAVYLEEIIVHDGPASDKAPVSQIDGLNAGRGTDDGETAIGDESMDGGLVGAASGSRKKLKSDETLKCHEQEDLVFHPRFGGSTSHSQEKTTDFKSELIIKQLDNNDSSEKKAQEASPVQNQVFIEAESSVQSGLKGGVDLAPLSYHGHPDGDEGAQKDDVSHVSSATNLDQSMLTSKKRKKPSQKKESSKRKDVNSNGEHGLEQVDGSRGAIPEAKPKESAAIENSGKQITDDMALVDEQVAPADVGDGSRVQKGLNLLLRESAELSGRVVADERSEKGDAISNSLATGMPENGSSRDKRKKSTHKRDLSRKTTAAPTEELELKRVENSSGTSYLAKHNKPDNKEDVIEKITVNTVVVHDQGAVANADLQGGIQHGPELVLGEINGQVNEKGATVSNMSVDDVGKNASAKKRKKSSQRKERSKKKNIDANQENLPKHVDDLVVNEKSENVIQADEEALNTDAGDVSRVQNDLLQEENNGKFMDYETIRGVTGFASHDPFIISVMEDKSSAKKRKKSRRTNDSSKQQPHDPDEKHVQGQAPIDKHRPKQIEVPEDVSAVPEPEEQDNTGKNIEENLDDTMSVHEQVLRADANYGGEVQNGSELALREENNSQIPGDVAISGTGKGHVAIELLASGVVGDESSKKKTKKSTDKPSKRKTVSPETLGQKLDVKKVLVMHVEDSVGANSSVETKDANNKEKIIKEKPADVVVVNEKTFDYNAGDGMLEENNELLHGDEANDEAKRVHSPPDSLASGDIEDELSKKKKTKSTTRPSKKKIDHTDENLALKQDQKEKVVLMHGEDSASIHEQTFDVDANDRVQEENNKQFNGDEANGEAKKVNLALDLLASCVMEVESSKKKTEKPLNKQNQKRTLHLEKLVLKQDPKEKVAPKYVKDSVGANTSAETKEADNEQKCKENSVNVVVAHEQTFDADTGDRVQEGNNEQFDGAEANGEASKVNLALNLLASYVMEDESCKRKTKVATNKQNKKKSLQLEEKLTWKHDPKENVVPKQVKDYVGPNTSAETKEADNKENSADLVVVHQQTFDADAVDQVREENNEHLYGDEAAMEVEKVDLVPDLAVSGVVRDIFSLKKKKPTQTKDAITEKPIDPCEDHELENIESSPGGSSLARPGELVNSRNYFSVVEGNESITPFRTDVDSQEAFKRKGMAGTAPETQKKRKRKQTAADRSVEQEVDVSSCSEMSKKEMQKFISASSISKSGHRLSSASPVRTSDGKHEDYGSINFSDCFTPTRPQVVVAASTDEVAGMKGNVKINPANIRKSRNSEASPSAIEVTKNNKTRLSHLDRYCVAFRNSSNQSLQKRSLLDKSGLIFKDETSDGSDDGQRSGMSDATTRTPSDDTASSDYSDGDSNVLKKSQGSGNGSQPNGRRSNMKNLLSTAGKDVELTKILQRSSRYKMAKKAASQSQEKDMDSEPVDFVPDSQADV
ncbi:hypothetical protein MLD38_011902 [Melastoma candidum]|uniref:Uncharacterized protein n=1 Tax=Melastoma candidum TaxID=119954 RepID=A0ACB9R4N9_9MYRT|nr:hypothetical protein MLD38_011902 [Melastoma candidum]